MVYLETANNSQCKREGHNVAAGQAGVLRVVPGKLAAWQSWPPLWIFHLEDPLLVGAVLQASPWLFLGPSPNMLLLGPVVCLGHE